MARRIFLLNSDPTGLVCHEPGNLEAGRLRAWMYGQIHAKVQAEIIIPAIVDYEIRRELILGELWARLTVLTLSILRGPSAS